jgi:formate-dependent nitrite reductase membrane component NrfD
MRSYYGRQILKTPVWRHDIPAYLFSGGLAAGSALLAAGADLTGRPALRRSGRLTALGAVGTSAYLLIHDLGRPARFHHMLRVVKPTSPMSMGSWILAAFGPAAAVAAASEVTGVAAGLGRVAGLAAAGVAPALATYTAVLLADTAVPSWHEAYPELPFAFAGGALAGAAGAGLLGAGAFSAAAGEVGPARRFALTGVAMELAALRRLHTRLGVAGEPYETGSAGRLLRASRALTATGVAGAVLGRSRMVSALSGVALLAASALTRFGIFAAGVSSTKDPRYTVVPQRERLAARSPSADDERERLAARSPSADDERERLAARSPSADDERDAIGAGREQLADDRITRDLPGDQQPA